jgi:hypothetical protein
MAEEVDCKSTIPGVALSRLIRLTGIAVHADVTRLLRG